MNLPRLFCASALGLLILVDLSHAASSAAAGKNRRVPGADLFTNGPVRQIRLQLSPTALDGLRKDARSFVRATVIDGAEEFRDVAVHLKGAVGSFRKVDDKPAFTLNFGKFTPGQTFHGLRKIHLNNSAEDPSYLSEILAGDVFRAAGVPATRVAHAVVELNGRKLGLYVLKEGFTKDFLGLYFKNRDGNLYDMNPGRDVTARLERDSGDGPDDWTDLQALTAACQEPDAAQRWTRLQATLDVERFIAFMAMEVMTSHWDGYCVARNNFRVYHDMDTDRILFFPHGTDELFKKPTSPIYPPMSGLVARAVMQTPEGRRRYRDQFGTLFTNVFKLEVLTNRVQQIAARLRPVFKDADHQAAALCERLAQRVKFLEEHLGQPEPAPLKFSGGVAKISGWSEDLDEGNARHERTRSGDKEVLRIQREGGDCIASWRASVLLAAGHYRFVGLAKTKGLVPLKSESGVGGGLRISGGKRQNKLVGDTDWMKLEFEFTVADGGDEVRLVCELRASKGEILFDLDSLRLEQIK